MKFSVSELQGVGAFSGAPVKREIAWTGVNGERHTADVWVRRLSYHSAVSDVRAVATDGDMTAGRIASCICDEEGKPVFTVADITGVNDDGSPVLTEKLDEETGEVVLEDGKPVMVERGALDDEIVTQLMFAISEVNRLGKSKPSN